MSEDEYNQNLYPLAEALAHEYARQKAARTGKPYYGNTKWDKRIWLRVAALVDKLHATPENFLTAQFQSAKGSVFAASLSGKVAEQRYLRWFGQMQPDYDEETDEQSDESLDIRLLRERIQMTIDSLLYDCKSTDLLDVNVCNKIIATRYHWDPVVMIMINPTPQFKEVFGEQAKEEIDQSRGLRDAIIELGFGMVLDYLEGKED